MRTAVAIAAACFSLISITSAKSVFALEQSGGTAGGKGESSPSSGGEASDSSAGKLEEVIVTATRREQNAQVVAGGLQVFGGAELERAGAKQFSDYLLTVPGVSFRDQGGGATRVALRGISNIAASDIGVGVSTTTTGMYLNDISVADTSNVPDLAIYDLERIEVLKGPQGTLYGEGAMGGAIKMILNAPDLSKFEARAETALSGTKNGGFNYQARGVANLPLVADRLGLRLVGGYDHRDGFIDNIATGRSDVNGSHQYSVRGTLLWQPTDSLSAELLALRNKQHQDAFDQINTQLPDLEVNSLERQYADTENSILGLTLKYDLGFAGFTSISSYYSSKRERESRVPAFGTVFGQFGAVTQEPSVATTDLSSVSQELRLVSNGDQRLNWVAGLFYRDKKQDGFTRLFLVPSDLAAVNAGLTVAGLPVLPDTGDMLTNPSTEDYKQHAVYGELNFKLFGNLELTGGLRWFEETDTNQSITTAYSFLAASSGVVDGESKAHGVIPKYGLSYKFSDDHLIYAQAAKGFRSGVVNNFKRTFQVGGDGADSDSLWNYELGAKTIWADHRLRINGSVFYVDWKDVQSLGTEISPVSSTPISFFINGGDAELLGAELELVGIPTEGLLLGLNAGYTHNKMVRVVAATDMIKGSPLPNVPEWTASSFFEYRVPVPVAANSTGFMRFDVQYTDKQATRPITTTGDGYYVESYSIGKLQLGVETGRWMATLFVDNLWDERAQLGRGLSGNAILNPELIDIARPRTYGIRVSTSF